MQNSMRRMQRESMTDEQPQILQKEGIKLLKMSKGFNWEIKILDLDIDKL